MSLAKFLASEVSVPLYDLVQCKKQINKKTSKDEIDLGIEHQEDLLSKVFGILKSESYFESELCFCFRCRNSITMCTQNTKLPLIKTSLR